MFQPFVSSRKLAPFFASISLLVSSKSLAQTHEPPPANAAPEAPAPATLAEKLEPIQTSAPAAPTNAAQQAPPVRSVETASAPVTSVMRTDKLHDGFYLRLNLGFATQWSTIDNTATVPNFSAKDTTIMADLLIGAAPSPGIVFGGALLVESLPSTKFTAGSTSAKTGMMLSTLGPFIDAYTNARGGFHSGGMLGVSTARLIGGDYFEPKQAYGFGLATWLGYDCWVADQWQVGGLLQFSGSHLGGHGDVSDLGLFTRSVALLMTAVYQ